MVLGIEYVPLLALCRCREYVQELAFSGVSSFRVQLFPHSCGLGEGRVGNRNVFLSGYMGVCMCVDICHVLLRVDLKKGTLSLSLSEPHSASTSPHSYGSSIHWSKLVEDLAFEHSYYRGWTCFNIRPNSYPDVESVPFDMHCVADYWLKP